jgi:hypothetical protein
METNVAQTTYQSVLQESWQTMDRLPLPPSPPSRLGIPITIGVVVEIVTLITVMLLCASNQFGVWNFVLAILGILIPLLFVVWGFRRLTLDEAQSQKWMRDHVASLQEAQTPLPPKQESVATIPEKELIGAASR